MAARGESVGPVAPVISVVLPVFNGESFLREAVNSIVSQSESDFELIAINDGSTDRSGAILDEFGGEDERIKVFHRANKGLVDTLNFGVSLARGKYIARMDADDIACRRRFEVQRRYLDTHIDCVAVGSAVTLMSEDGLDIRLATYPTGPKRVAKAMLSGCAMAHPTVMMRREPLLAVGGYRGALAHAEDYDLWLRLLQRGSIDNLPQPLLRYRQHVGQVSRRHAVLQAISTEMARALFDLRAAGLMEPALTAPVAEIDAIQGLPLPFAARVRIYLAGAMADLPRIDRADLDRQLLWIVASPSGTFSEPHQLEQLWRLVMFLGRQRELHMMFRVALMGLRQSPFGFVKALLSVVIKRSVLEINKLISLLPYLGR